MQHDYFIVIYLFKDKFIVKLSISVKTGSKAVDTVLRALTAALT